MVAGAVAPPRIDLRNRDLIRSHVHAIWMEVAKPDLGKTLAHQGVIIHQQNARALPGGSNNSCLAPHTFESPLAGAGTQQETFVPR